MINGYYNMTITTRWWLVVLFLLSTSEIIKSMITLVSGVGCVNLNFRMWSAAYMYILWWSIRYCACCIVHTSSPHEILPMGGISVLPCKTFDLLLAENRSIWFYKMWTYVYSSFYRQSLINLKFKFYNHWAYETYLLSCSLIQCVK